MKEEVKSDKVGDDNNNLTRGDQKRFHSCHAFYSLCDLVNQLAVHNRRSNNFPMRPLAWRSPNEFFVQYV